jgi:hypothetical protein
MAIAIGTIFIGRVTALRINADHKQRLRCPKCKINSEQGGPIALEPLQDTFRAKRVCPPAPPPAT